MAKKKTRGFTLAELIIVMALGAMVLASAGSLLYSGYQSFRINSALQEDQYQIRMALDSITRELRRIDIKEVAYIDAIDQQLNIIMNDGGQILYELYNDGVNTPELQRNCSSDDVSDVAFSNVQLGNIVFEPEGPDVYKPEKIRVTATGVNGTEVITVISLSRSGK